MRLFETGERYSWDQRVTGNPFFAKSWCGREQCDGFLAVLPRRLVLNQENELEGLFIDFRKARLHSSTSVSPQYFQICLVNSIGLCINRPPVNSVGSQVNTVFHILVGPKSIFG